MARMPQSEREKTSPIVMVLGGIGVAVVVSVMAATWLIQRSESAASATSEGAAPMAPVFRPASVLHAPPVKLARAPAASTPASSTAPAPSSQPTASPAASPSPTPRPNASPTARPSGSPLPAASARPTARPSKNPAPPELPSPAHNSFAGRLAAMAPSLTPVTDAPILRPRADPLPVPPSDSAAPLRVEPTTAARSEPPPTPRAQATAVYAPDRVVAARVIALVPPEYSDLARGQGLSGVVVVHVTVGPRGNVLGVRIAQSSGHAVLDQAALAAARQSKYQPPVIDAKPATETYRLEYSFP